MELGIGSSWLGIAEIGPVAALSSPIGETRTKSGDVKIEATNSPRVGTRQPRYGETHTYVGQVPISGPPTPPAPVTALSRSSIDKGKTVMPGPAARSPNSEPLTR